MYYGEDKPLTLINPRNEKEQLELDKATTKEKYFSPFIFNRVFYSEQFGPINISSYLLIGPQKGEIDIYPIKINVINPDNWDIRIKNNIKKLGNKIISGKDMALVYISTDALPGYKIIPNKIEFSKYEGDLIYTKEYGILFIHVIEEWLNV